MSSPYNRHSLDGAELAEHTPGSYGYGHSLVGWAQNMSDIHDRDLKTHRATLCL